MFSQLRNLFFSQLLRTNQCLRRQLHLSQTWHKLDDRRSIKALPKDDGTEGERVLTMDSYSMAQDELFPTEDLPNRLFNNVPFSQVPICNIKVSKNNTILTITDAKGTVKLIRSCGIEGFKNTRKGTNIAAQATAITFGTAALSKGFNMVRVRVQGLGPGRMSALKGLQMAGLNVISITDSTRVSWNPPRPRKQRRL